MKLETFFEKFELFVDAPDAVAKMRESIFNLAATGRLSRPQKGDDSSAEFVDALSQAMATQGTSRTRARAASAIKSTADRPFEVPPHWAWMPLYEIGVMSGGMTPSKGKPSFWSGDVNWFSSKDIKSDELVESELKITREAAEATRLQIYAPGCLVMVARSGILKRTFPVSILRSAGTVNQDLKVLRPYTTGMERYLQIMLRGLTGFILESLVKTGMTVQSLKYEEFEEQLFPLPPMAEQKRIVEKVDELMALCDRLEAQQQERETRHATLARASLARFAEAPTPANLEFLFHNAYAITPADLRKSILTLAVQGSLSKSHVGRKECSLKDACLLITDGEHATPERTPSGVPLATAKNVRDGYLDLAITDFVAERTAEKCWRRCKPRAGDVLMVCVGATTGRVCRLEAPVPEMVLVRSVALLRVDPQMLSPAYLDVFLRSPLGQDQVWSGVKQNAQPCLYLGKMSAFEIAIPPLAEQRRIVAKVDELMALVDKLEAELASARTAATNLLAAAVAELTNGKEPLSRKRNPREPLGLS